MTSLQTIGLTGGIGAGKSTVAGLLRRKNVPFVDTDVLAHKLARPGCPALAEIREAFGSEVIGPEGALRRSKLAEEVFGDPDARRRLEAILHPRIQRAWRAEVTAWQERAIAVGVVVIPLLFELGMQADFSMTICVGCSSTTQQRRLRERGWTQVQIDQRLRAQWPMSEKMECADRVIWNEGTERVLARQVELVFSDVGLKCP